MLYQLLYGYYAWTNWDYYLQLFLAAVIILWGQKRKSKFYLRLSLAALTFFAFCFFVPNGIRRLYTGLPFLFYTSYDIIYFLTSFFLLVFLMIFTFKITFKESLYGCIAGYLIQHMFFALHHILLYLWPFYSEHTNLNKILPTIPIVLVALLTYSIVKRHNNIIIKSQRMFTLSIFTLVVNIVISVFPASLGENNEGISFAYLYYIMVIICGIILLILLFASSSESELQNRVEVLNKMWEEDRKNYEIQKADQETFNTKIHDLKHFINSFKGEIPQESIEKMQYILNRNYPENTTGSVALDVILQTKLRQCYRHNIQLTFIGDGRLLGFIEEHEIYSLFSNLIDNAMEAVEPFTEDAKRMISISITNNKGVIMISSSNYFNGEIKVINNEIETTKADSKHHGYGLKSMKSIAEKYHGYISLSSENNIFHISIIFPQQEDGLGQVKD